jgi:hypothetical protein
VTVPSTPTYDHGACPSIADMSVMIADMSVMSKKSKKASKTDPFRSLPRQDESGYREGAKMGAQNYRE